MTTYQPVQTFHARHKARRLVEQLKSDGRDAYVELDAFGFTVYAACEGSA